MHRLSLKVALTALLLPRTSAFPKTGPLSSIIVYPSLSYVPHHHSTANNLIEVTNLQHRDDVESLNCKRRVQQVATDVGNNPTETTVDNALQSVGSTFPPTDRSQCGSFVNQYGHDLTHILLEESGDAELACTLMEVCLP